MSPDDRSFFRITDQVPVAMAEVLGFYRNYRSCRWVGDLLVLRMAVHPTASQLADLNRRFSDIVVSGVIRKVGPLPPERATTMCSNSLALLCASTSHTTAGCVS